MSGTQGRFVWCELMTADSEAAARFYGEVVGWSSRPSDNPEAPPYTMLSANGTDVAGIFPMEGQAHWIGYVAVDDVDAFVGRVTAAGGAVHKSPADIPHVGRFAIVADPEGSVFTLFTPGETRPPPETSQARGHVSWHELHADDPDAVLPFYEALFGWTRGERYDMGPAGPYQIFAVGGVPTGGVMRRDASSPRPGWIYYVTVEHIDEAATRLRQAGGKILLGPREVPGGSRIIIATDAQGAPFGLVSPAG